MEEYEYMVRLLLAGALGALIGLEREKRFKEAGLRTHFLVAVGSAVFMIVSKYAFQDVLGGDVKLDPSRVAAAIPSGIGFLGAGMILVQRTSIRGLTTAAGIWATAGIGLSAGAGMYEIAVFAGLLVIIGLEFLKMIFRPVIPLELKVIIKADTHHAIRLAIEQLSAAHIGIKDYRVRVNKEKEEGCTVQMQLRPQRKGGENRVVGLLQQVEGVRSVRIGT